MQLQDLIKPINDMTDEELQEHLRNIRHNRSVIRPAAKKKVAAAKNKKSKATVNKIEKMLAGMTSSQREEFLKNLGAN